MNIANRDVTLSVVFRLDDSDDWHEWTTGHRNASEALVSAEALVKFPPVPEIRFDRITRTTERLSLHALAAEDETAAQSPADRAALLAEDLRYVLNYRGPGHDHERPGVWDTSGKPCTHCARLATARRNLAAYDADPAAVLPEPADRAVVRAEALRGAADAIDAGWFTTAASATAELRRLAGEQPAQDEAPSPCSEVPCNHDGTGEPCSRHEREADLTERLENGRAQLIEAMSGVSEERWCAGWMENLDRRLHAEGGIWEVIGRAVGWPVGDFEKWAWVSWDEAAALYAAPPSA